MLLLVFASLLGASAANDTKSTGSNACWKTLQNAPQQLKLAISLTTAYSQLRPRRQYYLSIPSEGRATLEIEGFSNKLSPIQTYQIRRSVISVISDAPRDFYGRASGDANVFKITIQRGGDACSIVSVNGEFAGLPKSVKNLKRAMTKWSATPSR